jgi:hypothetical protein
LDNKSEEGTAQHQRHHRGASMDHEQIGGGLPPDLSIESFFRLAGSGVGHAAREKHHESE